MPNFFYCPLCRENVYFLAGTNPYKARENHAIRVHPVIAPVIKMSTKPMKLDEMVESGAFEPAVTAAIEAAEVIPHAQKQPIIENLKRAGLNVKKFKKESTDENTGSN